MEMGTKYKIHAYKHDGKLYRSWSESILIKDTDEYIVMINDKTTVKQLDGSTRKTREPAVIYYYKNQWYNIIAQLKKDGLFYYCNIATPYLMDGKVIKYIDYDLDLRIFPDGGFKILDGSEYNYHKNKMNYSKELDIVIQFELDNLIKMYKNKQGPFEEGIVKQHYEEYLNNFKK